MTKRALISRSRKKGCAISVLPPGLKIIKAMAAEGQDQVTISKTLGINVTSFRKLRDEVEAVGTAFDEGHAELADELTHIMLTHARKGNLTAAIFLAKSRLFWSDRHDGIPEEKRPNVVINLPASMTPEQWEEMTRANRPPVEIEHKPDIIEQYEGGKVVRG